MKCFDLAFSFTRFRECSQLPNIIRALGDAFSIAVVDHVAPEEGDAKTRITDRAALEDCRSWGAEILSPDTPCACRLSLEPQTPVLNPARSDRPRAEKRIMLQRFGSTLNSLADFAESGGSAFWIVDRTVFDHSLQARNETGQIPAGLELREMGAPYLRHPAYDFSQLAVDYLVAFPTAMLLKELSARLDLFRTMRGLFAALPADATVAIKLHNVRDGGYEFGRYPELRRVPRFLRVTACALSETLSCVAPRSHYLRRSREELYLADLYSKATPLDALTEKANYGIEHFLPFVRKGVITGISTCLWHALYMKIPAYNCDPRPLSAEMQNAEIYHTFCLPCCDGSLRFDESHFGRISPSCRDADLVSLIREELS